MSKILHRRLYEAYYSARKNKRTKAEQLSFEKHYECMLYKLYTEIINKTYKALPSRVFVIKKPVLREIFAPQFRDRVVHHLIYNYIYQYLDKKFIYDSYSCREGKGTLFGIERAKRFMRKASHNYTRDAYVLKLDIRGYFMNINRKKLYEQLQNIINYESLLITHQEKACLQYLIREICLHNAAEGAQRCSPFAYWDGIPASKSLFCTPPDCGLPIGSLTSQLFSNVYLNELVRGVK
ncbi:reverse transcriptase domain-containing protein [Ornithobacterium rhinotracheale]|uniref:reverse transcriptase domain-containing protein n=1 Tax=Ornithobacterium rhinotracheale TaxID=28251 RepID=UPI004036B83E